MMQDNFKRMRVDMHHSWQSNLKTKGQSKSAEITTYTRPVQRQKTF